MGHPDHSEKMHEVPVFDLLWLRSASPRDVYKFFKIFEKLNRGRYQPRISIYGHEIATDGFYYEDALQLNLSTSYGTPEENKTYLKVDLSKRYNFSFDLKPGKELLPLY